MPLPPTGPRIEGFNHTKSIPSNTDAAITFSGILPLRDSPKQDQVAVLGEHASRAIASARGRGGCPRGSAAFVVQLPAELIVLFPCHQRASVRCGECQDSRPHSVRSGRLDFFGGLWCTVGIQPGEINLSLCRPGRHKTFSTAGDRIVRHGTRVNFPGSGADACLGHLVLLLVPQRQVDVAIVVRFLAVQDRQPSHPAP